jgi:K+-transporting ATPase ATPase C chain
MMRVIGGSVVAVVVMTLFFGLLYPLAMTGFASVAFPSQAQGSLIKRDGVTIGSHLAAQGFSSAKYFVERPTATSPPYNTAGTTFENYGPTNPALAKLVSDNAKAVIKLEGRYNQGLTIHDIPVDAVVTSASGIDPDISPAYAQLQSHRIAAVRHLPLATVQKLISQNTDGRWLGVFGEAGVNVLDLNLALDKETGQ